MKIGVWGSGAIGCYLAGQLLKTGHQLSLLGRSSIHNQIKAGLSISGIEDQKQPLPCPDFFTDPARFPAVDLLIVTLKCTAIKESLNDIARVIDSGTPILFLQNGLGLEHCISQYLNNHKTYSGIVGFNVVNLGSGHFHQATEGELIFEASDNPALTTLSASFESAGMKTQLNHDMLAVQWGKLLLNLNNPINALADIPLLEELSQLEYRQVLAACQQETLQVLKKARIKPARLTASPPFLLPKVLRLPNVIFSRLAKAMLDIDPLARSSMWEDLHLGRKTEINYLNGAVVNLAQEQALKAPVNQAILELVQQVENKEIEQGISASTLKRLLGI